MRHPGYMLLGAGLAMMIVGSASANPLICCVEFPEMLPPEYRTLLNASLTADKQSLTLIEVEIDPLGADPMTPWIVQYNSLNVRTGPATTFSVVGSIPRYHEIPGVYYLVLESDEEWLEVEYEEQPRYISRTGVHRIHPTNAGNIAAFTNIPYGEELVNRWWGVPLEYEADDLVDIPSDYTTQISGRDYLLRQEAADAVVAMIDAARADGVNFLVASPYRSGASQRSIYNNNVSNSGLAQRFSAPPGHSEHQLGTTVDFSFPGGGFINNSSAQHAWLAANADDYGFRQSYTADNIDETGYIEEPWHWRYWGVETSTSLWLLY